MHCIESKTGIYTRIEDAKRGASFTCLVCDEPALIREGDKNVKHFAHFPLSASPCVTSKESNSGGTRETPEQWEARLILKNCVETDRTLFLTSLCDGTHCQKAETTLYSKLHHGPLTIHPAANLIHVYTHSVLQNYKAEGELFFSCEPDWKCDECQLFETTQAKKFEENRIKALREANIRTNTFDFGKYIGKTFDWVIQNDPVYFKFMLSMESTSSRVCGGQLRMHLFLSHWIKKHRL